MRKTLFVASLAGAFAWGTAAALMDRCVAADAGSSASPPTVPPPVDVAAEGERSVILLRFTDDDEDADELKLMAPGDESAIPVPDKESPESGENTADKGKADAVKLEREGGSSRRAAKASAIPTVEPDDALSNEFAPGTSETATSGLSPQMVALRDRVREVLGFYHGRRLNTRDHNPWEVMHSIVAYGVHSELDRGGPDGPMVNAISWLCWNGDCKGVRILEVVDGRVVGRKGPMVQGHPGQFVAILAQGSVATQCPIKIGNQRFTLADLLESERRDCKVGMELTFKLIAFSHYFDINSRWKTTDGETWNIERLVHEELSQPIIGAACGGTHRLMGLAYAVRKRQQAGLPLNGEFGRAKKFLDDYHRYTLTRLQNSDGSFSTEWFRTPGARPDLNRRIQTSGHILEWLSYSLSLEMLEDPRIVKAVEYLTDVLENKRDGEVGPLGHALHSLAIYDSRMFKPYDDKSPRQLTVQDDALPVVPEVTQSAPAPRKPTPPQATARRSPFPQGGEGSSRRPAPPAPPSSAPSSRRTANPSE